MEIADLEGGVTADVTGCPYLTSSGPHIIVRAIAGHDADAAYRLLYEHIQLSMTEALEVLDEKYYE